MVGGSLTSSARTGATDISEVKTTGESASIRRIMFPPRGFAIAKLLFLLAGTRRRRVATTGVRAINAQCGARNRQIVADESLNPAARLKFRQWQSPVPRQQHHQA